MRRGGAAEHGRHRQMLLRWVKRKTAGEGSLKKLETEGL